MRKNEFQGDRRLDRTQRGSFLAMSLHSFPFGGKPTLGNETLAWDECWAEAWALEVRLLEILLWDYALHKDRAVSVPSQMTPYCPA